LPPGSIVCNQASHSAGGALPYMKISPYGLWELHVQECEGNLDDFQQCADDMRHRLLTQATGIRFAFHLDTKSVAGYSGAKSLIFQGQGPMTEQDAKWGDTSCPNAAAPPSPEPSPEPTPPTTCDNEADLEERVEELEHACCAADESRCSSGFPDSCDAQCAAVLLPMQSACSEILSQRLWSLQRAKLDEAAATCPATGGTPCGDTQDLQQRFEQLTHACCADQSKCSSGYPSSCDAKCAAVLLPMRSECAEVLGHPVWLPVREQLGNAAATCPAAVSTNK
jgi:hypothetical protein